MRWFGIPGYTEFRGLSTTYDELDRIKTLTTRDGIEQFDYDGLITYRIDSAGSVSTTIRNTLGMIIVEDDPASYVTYYRAACGDPLFIVDPLGRIISIRYNALGKPTYVNDPDRGIESFRYNDFGELIVKVRSDGSVTLIDHDDLGRLIGIRSPDGNAVFNWDHAEGKGIGRLSWADGPNGHGERRSYDSRGRLSSTDYLIKGDSEARQSYIFSYGYDDFSGRATRLTYPSTALSAGMSLEYIFDDHGIPIGVKDQATGSILLWVVDMDAEGRPTKIAYGNGTTERRDYAPLSGRLAGVEITCCVGKPSQKTLWKASFTWDSLGSIVTRTDSSRVRPSGKERYVYDASQRLLEVWRQGTANSPAESVQTKMGYDFSGNVTANSNLSGMTDAYRYEQGRPHAVASISVQGSIQPWAFSYDAGGNQTTARGGTVIRYNSWAKPSHADIAGDSQQLGISIDYEYGPSGHRVLKRVSKGHNHDLHAYCR